MGCHIEQPAIQVHQEEEADETNSRILGAFGEFVEFVVFGEIVEFVEFGKVGEIEWT